MLQNNDLAMELWKKKKETMEETKVGIAWTGGKQRKEKEGCEMKRKMKFQMNQKQRHLIWKTNLLKSLKLLQKMGRKGRG